MSRQKGKKMKMVRKDMPKENEWTKRQEGQVPTGAAQERNRQLQKQGIVIPDIASVWVDAAAEIAAGCILYPNTQIFGSTKIGADCHIGPNCRMEDTVIGKGCRVSQSQIEHSELAAGCTLEANCQLKGATIGENSHIMQSQIEDCKVAADCEIGPFSYLRNKAAIGKGSQIRQSQVENSTLAAGCTLEANCQLKGAIIGENSHIMQSQIEDCKVAADCEIGPFSHIRAGTEIGRACRVAQSKLEDSRVAEECNIGPFSYLRPGSVIGNRVRIGDFVEIKNSVIGDDTMISHLTYVGDADVGCQVNFGCGTVLVNYDGIQKHRSVIGDHAFIGCNTNLVSPVRIGEGAFTAAGSTITEDLPPGSLGIARARQQIKEDWVTHRKGPIKGGGNK